jgi:hypothetical protein
LGIIEDVVSIWGRDTGSVFLERENSFHFVSEFETVPLAASRKCPELQIGGDLLNCSNCVHNEIDIVLDSLLRVFIAPSPMNIS